MTASLVTRRALLLTLSNRKNSSGRSAEKCHATYTKRTPPASAGKRMRATKTKAGQGRLARGEKVTEEATVRGFR